MYESLIKNNVSNIEISKETIIPAENPLLLVVTSDIPTYQNMVEIQQFKHKWSSKMYKNTKKIAIKSNGVPYLANTSDILLCLKVYIHQI